MFELLELVATEPGMPPSPEKFQVTVGPMRRFRTRQDVSFLCNLSIITQFSIVFFLKHMA